MMGELQESLVVPGDSFLGTGSPNPLKRMNHIRESLVDFHRSSRPGVFVRARHGCASAHWSCVKLCAHHEKRPGESCADTNRWRSAAAALCSSLVGRHDGSSHLCPGLNRLGIPHLASILSAYAQSRSPHLLHARALLFRAVLQIQESESREQFR